MPDYFAEIGANNYDGACELLETLMKMGGTDPQGILSVAIEELSGRIARYEEAQSGGVGSG